MKRALIGYSGFVGGNIARQAPFDDFYNSKNVEEVSGRAYDLAVCAAAPAEKWKANRHPETDLKSIERLERAVAAASIRKLVLISTIDVYPRPVEVDEYSAIDASQCQPYGAHRLMLERFLAERFDTVIIRLPGLYGDGLKKNMIYDFLHGNNVSQIHADSVYQFYSLDNIWRDLTRVMERSIKLMNFATEPVSAAEVARHAFGVEFTNRPTAPPARYDFRTRHAAVFNGANGYLTSKADVLDGIRSFVERTRGKR